MTAGSSTDSPEEATRGRPRYLADAVRLARGEAGPPGAGDHLAALIRLNELASSVGVGRTALYKAWPSRGELWSDIVVFASYSRDSPRPDSELPWSPPPGSFEPIDLTSPYWIEAIRQQTNGTADLTLTDPSWVIRAAVLAYPESAEVARSRRAVEGYRMATLARRIAIGVGRGQRNFPGPFTLRHLTEAAWAVMDGIVVASHWHDQLATETVTCDDGSGPQPWHIGSWAYRAPAFEHTRVVAPGADPVGPFDAGGVDPDLLEPPHWSPTQRAVLAAGIEALVERLSSEQSDTALVVLPHLTIDRVARASHVSRRAIYDVWPTRDGLLLDVLDELLWAEHRRHVQLADAVAALVDSPAVEPGVFAACLAGTSDQGDALELAASAFLPQCRHPDVRALLVEHHQRNVGIVAGCLSRLDPPLEAITPTQVAEIIVALVTGLRRVRRVHGDQGWAGDLGVTLGGAISALCRHRPSSMH